MTMTAKPTTAKSTKGARNPPSATNGSANPHLDTDEVSKIILNQQCLDDDSSDLSSPPASPMSIPSPLHQSLASYQKSRVDTHGTNCSSSSKSHKLKEEKHLIQGNGILGKKPYSGDGQAKNGTGIVQETPSEQAVESTNKMAIDLKANEEASAQETHAAKPIELDNIHEDDQHESSLEVDRSLWQGFCEIESDPAFFTVMLREFGVRDIRVEEVFDLDTLTAPNQPQVYALVFLYRYLEKDDEKKDDKEQPNHVWFANQVATNSCATMALLNIVNNVPSIELGQYLETFKAFSKDLTPLQRGEAVMNFEYVKRIHNSFARKSDIVEADLNMKNRYAAACKRKQEEEREIQKMQNTKKSSKNGKLDDDCQGDVNDHSLNKTSAYNCTKRESKPRGSKNVTPKKRKLEEYETDAGYHFIAFMPIEGELWQLDGMDKSPINLGSFDEGFGWLECIRPVLEVKMVEAGGDIGFSLMALLRDPAADLRNELAEINQTIQTIESVLDEKKPLWRDDERGNRSPSFPATLSQSLDTRGKYAIELPSPVKKIIEEGDSAELMKLRTSWFQRHSTIQSELIEAQRTNDADEAKAAHRRVDFGDFIVEWVKMLAEGDLVRSLVDCMSL